jgi:hypothetical protein
LLVQATAAARRPFLSTDLAFLPGSAPVLATPAAFALPNLAGQQDRTFTLDATNGGLFQANLRLSSAVQGWVQRPLDLELVQLLLQAGVDQPSMGAPATNRGTATLAAGPFERVQGTLTLRIQPEGLLLATQAFDVSSTAVQLEQAFNASGLAFGPHTVEARATFTAWLEGQPRSGDTRASAPFTVLRPQVDLEKRFAASSVAGSPLAITSIFRNVGTHPATGLVVRETVPLGYAYWVRDGPVPVPTDPLGRPAPTRFEVREDGGLDVVWELGTLAPGAARAVSYRVLPLLPGEASLPSSWDYAGSFPEGSMAFHGQAAPPHATRLP